MSTKDARVDIKTTKAAKTILEQAAYAMGTTLSAFILDCAMPKAREVIAQSDSIRLNRKETERFIAALESAPRPNKKLKNLFKIHRANKKPHHREKE